MSSSYASEMDDLLYDLDGGALFIQSEHHPPIAAHIHETYEHASDDWNDDVDFAIVTRTQWAAMSVHFTLPIVNLTDESPYNPDSIDHRDFYSAFGQHGITDWPRHTQMSGQDHDGIDLAPYRPITGLTIHHTLRSTLDDMLSLERWITTPVSQGGKGCPRGQYHYAVSPDAGTTIYQLLSEDLMPWHDHTGRYQTALSIGMMGSLHLQRPREEQLWRTVQLVAYLLSKHNLTVDDVQGHNDRAGYPSVTVCPGWYADTPTDNPSGVWKRDFCIALQLCLSGGTWGGY